MKRPGRLSSRLIFIYQRCRSNNSQSSHGGIRYIPDKYPIDPLLVCDLEVGSPFSLSIMKPIPANAAGDHPDAVF